MEKQPLTNSGFTAIQAELYIQSDAELNLQADEIKMDFIGWLIANFELQPSQIIFLSEVDPRVLSFIAAQTSFAVSHRLRIKLDKPDSTSHAEKGKGKVMTSSNTLKALSDDQGDADGEGSLTIHIQYPS